jgi:Protein kinase domain
MMRETSLDDHGDHQDHRDVSESIHKSYNGIANNSLMILHRDIGATTSTRSATIAVAAAGSTATAPTTANTTEACSRQEADEEARSRVQERADRDGEGNEEKKQEHVDGGAQDEAIEEQDCEANHLVSSTCTTSSTPQNPNPNNNGSHQDMQEYLHYMGPVTDKLNDNPPEVAPPAGVALPNAAPKKAGTFWWERVVVQRSSYVVEELVAQYMAGSVFLQSDPFPVAWFDRIEIETGDLLGSGTYSNVSQVRRLELVPDFLADHPVQDQLRRELMGTVAHQEPDVPGTTTGYAIKHLKAELLQNSKLFEAAAADIIMEAKFLSRLSHPNILRLRGMAMGGTSAFAATGLYDSYFLVVDELKETLIERIHRWKVQGTTDQYRSNMVLYKLRLAVQVASALAYLHERRLVFRDLKPHNIGIRDDGTISLFDFGFCRELPAPETALSPEQAALARSGGGSPRRAISPTSMEAPTVPENKSPVVNNDEDEEKLFCMSGKGTLMYMSPGKYHRRRKMIENDIIDVNDVLHSSKFQRF